MHGGDGDEEVIDQLIDDLGLRGREDDLPSQFSRGLRQKTAAAVALCRPFSLLLVDEPFVGLDASGRQAFLDLLADAHDAGATLMVATHDPVVLDRFERGLVLDDGQIIHDGPASGAVEVPVRRHRASRALSAPQRRPEPNRGSSDRPHPTRCRRPDRHHHQRPSRQAQRLRRRHGPGAVPDPRRAPPPIGRARGDLARRGPIVLLGPRRRFDRDPSDRAQPPRADAPRSPWHPAAVGARPAGARRLQGLGHGRFVPTCAAVRRPRRGRGHPVPSAGADPRSHPRHRRHGGAAPDVRPRGGRATWC